jgi:2-iminobutanoate/2-iminopropanoate deaminase
MSISDFGSPGGNAVNVVVLASRLGAHALAAVGASLKGVVAVKVFVPDMADMAAVGEIVGAKFKGIDPANTTTCTPLGQPELKVEFEVTAYRRRNPAEPEERIKVDLS